MVERSLITLKALTYAPTGGIVAAVTTSLPEQLGGPRALLGFRSSWHAEAAALVPNAEVVLGLLPSWFEDCNAHHPHSGLKMRSPREFIAQQSATPAACPV